MVEMIRVKAKRCNDWSEWIYGLWLRPGVVRTFESLDAIDVNVTERTVCMDTGLKCGGDAVYENDWLAVEDNDGEIHKFLVAMGETEFRAFEDEDISFSLERVLLSKKCKIVGNLYD